MSESDYSAEEFLNWLCWTWAKDGERFYPPEETARECVEAVRENYEENYSGEELERKLAEAYQREYGEHCRAYTEATSKFVDAANWGFDPIERAARENRDVMERSGGEVGPIDWTWLGDRGEFIRSLSGAVKE